MKIEINEEERKLLWDALNTESKVIERQAKSAKLPQMKPILEDQTKRLQQLAFKIHEAK